MMTDRDSRDLAGAAYLADDGYPPDVDRPSAAELDADRRDAAERDRREVRRDHDGYVIAAEARELATPPRYPAEW